MLHQTGVEVYIQCLDRDERYTEYTKPGEEEASDTRKAARYIRVESGERYAIVTNFKEHYDFGNAEGVSITTLIDNGTIHSRRFYDREHIEDRPNIRCQKYLQIVNGKWMKAGLAFGDLNLDYDLFDSLEEVESLTGMLGRINVKITRGRQIKRSTPKKRSADRPVVQNNASKELIKGAGIAQNTRPELDGAIEVRRPMNKWEFKPLSDDRDDGLIFTFRYRSRMTLERLGIVPFSPVIAAAAGPILEVSTPIPSLPSRELATPRGVPIATETQTTGQEKSSSSSAAPKTSLRKELTRIQSEPPHIGNEAPRKQIYKKRNATAQSTSPRKLQRNASSNIQKSKLIEQNMKEDDEQADMRLLAKIKDEIKQHQEILPAPNRIPQGETGNGLPARTSSPATSKGPTVIDLTVDDLPETRSSSIEEDHARVGKHNSSPVTMHLEDMDEEDLKTEIRKIELQQRLKHLRRTKATPAKYVS